MRQDTKDRRQFGSWQEWELRRLDSRRVLGGTRELLNAKERAMNAKPEFTGYLIKTHGATIRGQAACGGVTRVFVGPYYYAGYGPDGKTPRNDRETVPCSKCGTVMYLAFFQPIRGVVRADCPCDPRCTGAHGPSCECSCGGANHGADYGYKPFR